MTKGLRINLIPPEINKKRKAEKGLLVMLGIIAIYIVFLFLISFFFGIQASQERAKLDKIKAETAVIDKEIAKFNVFKDRKATVVKHQDSITKATANQLLWHKFLNELSMIIPTNISISQLTLSNDQVSMKAVGYSHQDVAEFLVRISDLSELKDPWIDGSKDTTLEATTVLGSSTTSSSSSSTNTIIGVEFTLTAKLKNPGPTAVQPGTGTTSTSTPSSTSTSTDKTSTSTNATESQ